MCPPEASVCVRWDRHGIWRNKTRQKQRTQSHPVSHSNTSLDESFSSERKTLPADYIHRSAPGDVAHMCCVLLAGCEPGNKQLEWAVFLSASVVACRHF